MIIAPSLLAADFGHLAEAVDMINRSEAGRRHCVAMDGVFVHNISCGSPVIHSVQSMAQMPLDVHLMIVNPDRYISQVRDCGAMMMNVHYEACTHLHRTIQSIHDAGMKAAVTLNPATPVILLSDIISDVDMVLLMSVNPGFGGQSFIEHTTEKIRQLKALIETSHSGALIQVDGGINQKTAAIVADAGADVAVAGSSVFKAADPLAEIAALASV